MEFKMEKRNYKRMDFNAIADIFDPFNNYISRSNIRNISPDGAAIMSPAPIEVGTTVFFHILKRKFQKIDILCENIEGYVLRTEKKGKYWLQAIIFNNITKEEKARLLNLSCNN